MQPVHSPLLKAAIKFLFNEQAMAAMPDDYQTELTYWRLDYPCFLRNDFIFAIKKVSKFFASSAIFCSSK